MATREDYLALFVDPSEAMAVEQDYLGCGDEFISDLAIEVRDGLWEEPPSEYWNELIDDYEASL
jgi:hypothetical protein